MARAFDQADIGLELQQCLQHVARIADAHIERAWHRLRIAKAGEQSRQDIAANRIAGGNAQLDATLRGKPFEFVGLVEQREGARKELPSGFVDAEASGHTVEQRAIECTFELGQRSADRGLRHGKRLCRGGGAAVLGHGDKYRKLAQGQAKRALFHVAGAVNRKIS